MHFAVPNVMRRVEAKWGANYWCEEQF